jgi:glycosyltransferase involved in cell wall biosynthesis
VGGRSVLYSYPIWQTVSFSLVARKHIEHLRALAPVYEWDSTTVPDVYVLTPFALVVHPTIGSFWSWARQVGEAEGDFEGALSSLEERFRKYERVVGVDVADSDRVSELGIRLAEPVDALVVPSEWSRQAFLRSGYRKPVHVVPHGVDRRWVEEPPRLPTEGDNPALYLLRKVKEVGGKRLLLFWLWHSSARKGFPEVAEFYKRLRRERGDVALVVKTGGPLQPDDPELVKLGVVNVWGWLDDREKMMLYDVSDVTLLFSRGGAFEINGLESLARGVPIIAHRRGPWAEYSPGWCLVPEGEGVPVLPGNPIHVGFGYKVDVERAVDLAHAMLDDLDEYKAKAREHALRVVAREYTWDRAAGRLWSVVAS